ncbi:hypothetical protein [Methylobacterium sp. J-067]|uniref:hypothetical protein n=1 Tax=Methylobacterium sp. J-067 TaxID=2836648 RepID=UPI001FB8884B|nr:hypothetical protein [Methylobacterium sp. J-067]MCJ2023546.1 hypothetical protein [Methylobacterium sp. J-067]
MVWTLAGKTHVVLAYLLCTTQQEPAVIEPLQPPRVTAVSDMLPSKEFEQYGRMFIQDLHLFGNSMEEIIDCIIENYDESKKDELRNFVEIILGSNLTHEDLQRLWSATDSDIYFYSAERFKEFLRMTRDRLRRGGRTAASGCPMRIR